VTILTTPLAAGTTPTVIDGVRVVHVPGVPPIRFTRAWRRESILAARRLHTDQPFDVFHAQGSSGTSFFARAWPRHLGAGSVLSLHGTAWDEIRTAWWLLKRGESWRERRMAIPKIVKQVYEHLALTRPAAQAADYVIATSDEQALLIPQLCGLRPGQTRVVYNGIDLRRFRPASAAASPGGPLRLLCVARLIAEKGVQHAIDAIARLRSERIDVRLTIIGGGDFEPALRAQVNRLGLSDVVVFRGPVAPEALPEFYRGADLFINATTRANGYDLTMIQAQACGVPVIASAIGSTPTAVRPGISGVLVPAGDAIAVAAAVRQLADAAPRRRLGASARAFVLERFDEQRMIDDTIRVLADSISAVRGER
jgi:glycosyltransferase involved in cell wall biosynthesis